MFEGQTRIIITTVLLVSFLIIWITRTLSGSTDRNESSPDPNAPPLQERWDSFIEFAFIGSGMINVAWWILLVLS